MNDVAAGNSRDAGGPRQAPSAPGREEHEDNSVQDSRMVPPYPVQVWRQFNPPHRSGQQPVSIRTWTHFERTYDKRRTLSCGCTKGWIGRE
jgi:hypothetical protein